MIQLRRINGVPFYLNCELIKFVEATPDTLITLTQGDKFMVKETVDQVITLTENFHKRVAQEPVKQIKENASADWRTQER